MAPQLRLVARFGAGSAVIPYVSVFLGLAMGMVTVLAVLACINHSAHSMEATEVIQLCDPCGPGGWVRNVGTRCLLSTVPAHGFVRLDTGSGMFVAEGTPLCTLWPKPQDPVMAAEKARVAVRLGRAVGSEVIQGGGCSSHP